MHTRMLFFVFLYFFISNPSWSVELIQAPDGIWIRSIPAFDNTAELNVEINNKDVPVINDNGRLETFISQSDYCKSIKYKALQYGVSLKWVNLDNICLQNQKYINIIFITDTQKYHHYHEMAAKYINENLIPHQNIRLIINGGDLVQTSIWKEWDAYRKIASQYYSSKVPIIPVVGNHDYRNDPQLHNFKFIYGTATTEQTYYKISLENNLHIIVLNSNYKALNVKERQAQEEWLKHTLSSINVQEPVIITFHHPAYGSLFYFDLLSGARTYMLKHIMPIIFQYPNVKLVLNGHTHIYERLNVQGLDILIGGAAGGKLLPSYLYKFFKNYRFRSAQIKRTISLISYDTENFVFKVQSIDFLSGKVFDEFEIH